MVDRIQNAVNLARALQAYKSREPGKSSVTSGTIRELFSGSKLRTTSFNSVFPATAVIRGQDVKEIVDSNNLGNHEKLAVIRAYKLTVEEIYKNTIQYPTLTDDIFNDIVAKIDKFVNEFNSQLKADNDKVDNKKLTASFEEFQKSLTILNKDFIKFFVIRDGDPSKFLVSDGLEVPSIRVVGKSYSYLRGEINKLLSRNLKKAVNQLNIAIEEKKKLEKDFGVAKVSPDSSKLTDDLANWGHTATTIKNIVSGQAETIILSGKIMATILSIGRSVGTGQGQISVITAKMIQEDFVAVTGQISSSIDLTQATPGSLELKITSSGYFQQLRPEFKTGNQGRGSTVEKDWSLEQLMITNGQVYQDLVKVLGIQNPSVINVVRQLINIASSPTYKQNLIAQALSPLTEEKFKFKPTKVKLLDNSKKLVGKMVNLTKKSKVPKTPASKKLSINNTAGTITPVVNLNNLMAQINGILHDKIKLNMGTGNSRNVLNYRSGRFAESVKVERMSESRMGMITAFYSYMKNPYATFSQGGRQEMPKSRDPKLLISKSIREIAQTLVTNRLRAVNV